MTFFNDNSTNFIVQALKFVNNWWDCYLKETTFISKRPCEIEFFVCVGNIKISF